MPLGLLNLANEVILLIAEDLDPADLNSFLKANRYLAWLLTPSFYNAAVRAPFVHPRYKRETVLHWATAKAYEPVVKRLLESGAEVGEVTLRRKSALDYAAESGDAGILKLLLERGGKDVIGWTDKAGRSPLHTAALNGHESIVKILLDNGANVAVKTCRGKTALHLAAESGHSGVVKILMKEGIGEAGADKALSILDNRGRAPIHLAATNGHDAVVKELAAFGENTIQMRRYGATALHCAVKRGDLAIVRQLLQSGVDVNIKTSSLTTPLHWAAQYACSMVLFHNRMPEPIVKLLLEHGADPNAFNWHLETPLHYAAENGTNSTRAGWRGRWCFASTRKLRLLMEKRQAAAEKAHRAIIDLLIEHGAEINCRDLHSRRTPLQCAIAMGEVYVVKHLLEMKTDIEAKNYAGKTALFLAAELKDSTLAENLVRALLEYGADTTVRSSVSAVWNTPLEAASARGHKRVVELLGSGEPQEPGARGLGSSFWRVVYKLFFFVGR